jgi:hypothetical protein
MGTYLEETGWRQGSIVKSSDLRGLLATTDIQITDDLILIVASQSCDIANNNTELDPYVEVSVCRKIDTTQGNYLHNKNPRVLHTKLMCQTGDENVFSEYFVELKAFEKASIGKELFDGLYPDNERVLEKRELENYVFWLSARYSRPALPTTFNNLIIEHDPKGKLRDSAKKGNDQLVGIYVQINPNAEIGEGETYSVNLLGLVPAGFTGDISKATAAVAKYESVLQAAGMNVLTFTLSEADVSVAVFKNFKRFYLDDLSFQALTPLPPEIQV